MCCVCVQSWAEKVGGLGIQLQAYIDDRTIAAQDASHLKEAWRRSQQWNQENKWEVNLKKTHYLGSGERVNREWEEEGDPEVNQTAQCQILGQDVITRKRALPTRQRERVTTVLEACRKAQRLRLTPEMAQRVLSAAVLPKLAYGLQVGSLPQSMLRQVKGAIKAAMGFAHRIHSWEILCVIANPGHRLDPQAYLMYTHLEATGWDFGTMGKRGRCGGA